jgi:hypothetical protein
MTPASSVQGYVTTNPPASPRAAKFADMQFLPGVASNQASRDLKGRWVQSNRVRWHKMLPEKIGGWLAQTLTGANGGVYIGTCRAAWDWASNDGQYWIAFATESKLYLINNLTLYDITPLYQTSNLSNALSTTNTSNQVMVTDLTNNAWQVGDWITIDNSVTIGGLTLSGQYQITSAVSGNPNQYYITAASQATSTVANGGGSVTIEYDVSAGLAENGYLHGYGTGLYGDSGEYGVPTSGTGIPAKMRTWSLQNWGQDLVASFNGGSLYWWQWTTGPNARAALVANAPADIQRILVNADSEFLIAIGASDAITGVNDPMNVRWCSEGDLTDWTAVVLPVANTAGGQRLNFGSRMITGVQSRQQNLLWSDTQLYQMQFQGSPNIFGFNELGKCYLVGPNAAIDVNGVVYMMCFDDFMIYDGTLRVLPCDMWETVFGPADDSAPTVGFDRSQAEMTYCASYMTKSEVTWWYPASGTDVMQYITYNYEDNVWYGGTMPRTAMRDASAALANYVEYPFGFNNGTFYQHEIGYDEVEPGNVKNAMYWFLQSWDIGAQSDEPIIVNSIIPNFKRLRNGCQYSLITREYPEDPAPITYGPFIITPTTTRCDPRASGTQIALKIEAASVSGSIVVGQDFRMGVWQSQATPHGKRMGTASQGSPINTNNP